MIRHVWYSFHKQDGSRRTIYKSDRHQISKMGKDLPLSSCSCTSGTLPWTSCAIFSVASRLGPQREATEQVVPVSAEFDALFDGASEGRRGEEWTSKSVVDSTLCVP